MSRVYLSARLLPSAWSMKCAPSMQARERAGEILMGHAVVFRGRLDLSRRTLL
jgi:hypothetical protein